MKIRPLPGIDLARIAIMEPAFQRPALELMKLNGPPFSYRAVRRSTPDILNVQPGPLAPSVPTPWNVIEAAIGRDTRTDQEYAANLQVAQALYLFATETGVHGRRQDFHPLAIGMTAKVEFWSPAVVALNSRPTVVFLDPRKTSNLTTEARRFVFSVMHERIRLADPAYADVELGIVQFASPKKGPRSVVTHFAEGLDLFNFEDLDAMIRQTYALWAAVLTERADASRKADDYGPLFGAA